MLLLQYDPSKPLFGEMKYADKKKFGKMAFEFTQSRLSLYKDSKVSSHSHSKVHVYSHNQDILIIIIYDNRIFD